MEEVYRGASHTSQFNAEAQRRRGAETQRHRTIAFFHRKGAKTSQRHRTRSGRRSRRRSTTATTAVSCCRSESRLSSRQHDPTAAVLGAQRLRLRVAGDMIFGDLSIIVLRASRPHGDDGKPGVVHDGGGSRHGCDRDLSSCVFLRDSRPTQPPATASTAPAHPRPLTPERERENQLAGGWKPRPGSAARSPRGR